MIPKNEIEARMRRDHGSRRAGIVEEASPPNSLFRYGQGVGPWGIPAELSAVFRGGAIRLQKTPSFVWNHRGVEEAVGRGRVSTDFFVAQTHSEK